MAILVICEYPKPLTLTQKSGVVALNPPCNVDSDRAKVPFASVAVCRYHTNKDTKISFSSDMFLDKTHM